MLYAVTLEYRLPHVRGGVSATLIQKRKNNRSSPRAWGCFTTSTSSAALTAGLPHVRGGVSNSPGQLKPPYPSSPRAWGCFRSRESRAQSPLVFPTCVGVFLTVPAAWSSSLRLPHVRGGVSMFKRTWLFQMCVFPTCVGVFLGTCCAITCLLRLPHVRGGVSTILHIIMIRFGSSPRAWGCFSTTGLYTPFLAVFPTCVGVFPSWSRKPPGIFCLPHVRGGVSTREDYYRIRSLSSPRAWGCFLNPWNNTNGVLVFPTCVGVFLAWQGASGALYCLPHVRGGVSGVRDPVGLKSLSSPRAWGCFLRP